MKSMFNTLDFTSLLGLVEIPDFGVVTCYGQVYSKTSKIYHNKLFFNTVSDLVDALSEVSLCGTESRVDLIKDFLQAGVNKLVEDMVEPEEHQYINLLTPDNFYYINKVSDGIYLFVDENDKCWLEVTYEYSDMFNKEK